MQYVLTDSLTSKSSLIAHLRKVTLEIFLPEIEPPCGSCLSHPISPPAAHSSHNLLPCSHCGSALSLHSVPRMDCAVSQLLATGLAVFCLKYPSPPLLLIYHSYLNYRAKASSYGVCVFCLFICPSCRELKALWGLSLPYYSQAYSST